ncbi:MAG: gliding motility-associated C-terminal domain-containing protein [Crocinitomicaceae bacterium]
MRKLNLLLLCILLSINLFGQNWMNSAGSLFNDESYDVETDQFGNIYTTGYTTSQATFGGSITINTNGFSDIYVSKSDPSGNFLWVKVFGGSQADRGYDIELDDAGNIYITGYFQGTAQFDSFVLTSNGSQDVFVAKLNNQGDVIWVKNEGGPEGDTGYGITVDGSGNVIATGQFKGNATIGANTFNSALNPTTSLPEFDIFVCKYDANGNDLWSIQGSAKYDDRGLAIQTDANDNILVTGQFSDTLTIAGSIHNNTIYNAGMLIKLDPMGNEVWFKRMGAVQTLVYDLEVDAQNNVFITGDFQGQLMILSASGTPSFLSGNYQYRFFVIKFNEAGEIVWMTEDDSDSEVSSKAIIMDVSGNLYVSGTFKCVMNEYADELGEGYFNSVGYNDVFIAKFDPSGTREWMRQYGGPYDDYCSGIAINSVDKPIISGGYTEFFNYPRGGNFANFSGINHQYGSPVSQNGCAQVIYYDYLNAKGNKDIFVGNPVDLNVSHYYYYQYTTCGSTSVPCILLTCPDSLEFCSEGTVSISSKTAGNGLYPSTITSSTQNDHPGPFFDYSWNTGSTDPSIMVGLGGSGTYWVESNRIDGCNQYIDSVEVIVHDLPTLPLLSDNFGMNLLASDPYSDITVCQDTVSTWFNNLDSNLTLIYDTPIGQFGDTSIHDFVNSGIYTVTVMDSNGCVKSDEFKITIESPIFDTLVPYIIFDRDTVCEGQKVNYVVADSITNPNGDYTAFCSGALIVPNTQCVDGYLLPSTSGWYFVNRNIILGYTNTCGTESTSYFVQDSIYVTVLNTPTISYFVDGDPLLCPGDEVQVWTSDTIPGFNWSGSGISSINSTGDTINASTDGSYAYGGTLIDTLTGCSENYSKSFFVSYKTAAQIISNSPDNIICPNDSILLTCIDPVLNYTWVGPLGNTIGNTQSIYVAIPGFYHCIILDPDSCILTSNSIELKEYNTPYIIPEPGTELCHNGAIHLSAYYSGAPTLNWLAPINSADSIVTVSQPGTYYLQVTQCGFTVMDSITITDANISATITLLSDSIICPDDTAVLMANSGMAVYEWNPAFYGQTFQTSQPGQYVVTITDGATGCTATSDTITISYFPGGVDPTVASKIVCIGDSVLLVNTNDNVTSQWFLNDSTSTPFFTGDSLWLVNILQDTTIYVENFDANCISNRIAVNIELSPATFPPTIFADTAICSGSSIVLVGYPFSTGINYSWSGPNGFISNQNPVSVNQVDTSAAGYYYLTTSDAYCTSSDSIYIEVHELPIANIVEDTLYKCFSDTVVLHSFGNYTSVQWNTGEQTDSISVFIEGLYLATVSDSNGCQSFADSVVVNNYFTPQIVYTDTNICLGDSLIYSPDTNAIFSWYVQLDSLFSIDSILSTPPLFFDANFVGILTDSNGCENTVDVIDVSITPVNGAPAIYGDSSVCLGNSLDLQTDLYGGATYQWEFNGNVVSNSHSYSVLNISYQDTGTYTLIVSGIACIYSQTSVNVIVNQPPNMPLISGTSNYCPGDTIELDASNFADSVYWMVPNSMPYSGNPLIIPSASFYYTGEYLLFAVDSNSCISIPDTFNVVVHPLPQSPVLTYTSSCSGDTVELTTSTNYGNVTYTWSDSSGVIGYGDSLILINVDPSFSGGYMLTVTDSNLCSNSNSTWLQVDEFPVVDLGSDTLHVCIEDLPGVELEINDGYDFYAWQNGTNDYFIEIQDSGLYFVSASIGNCWASDSIYVLIDTCTIIYLAPNVVTPNGDGINDVFFVEFEFNKMMIMNRWGEVVFETNDMNTHWDGKDLQGKPVADGVYFYIIEAEQILRGNVQVIR